MALSFTYSYLNKIIVLAFSFWFCSNYLLFLRPFTWLHLAVECSFYGRIVSHWMNAPQFVYWVTNWWIFEFFPVLVIMHKNAIYINAEVLLWKYVSIYLGVQLLLYSMLSFKRNWVLRAFTLEELDKILLICLLQHHLLPVYLPFLFSVRLKVKSGHQWIDTCLKLYLSYLV